MKTLKRIFHALFLLIVSTHAKGTGLHKPADNLPKETIPGNVPVFNSLNNTHYSFTTNAVDNIDADTTAANALDARVKAAIERLKEKAAEVKEFAKKNNFSTDYCFLIDMSIPSGKNRFFVYNIKKDMLESAALVSHGFGSYKENCNDQLVFSNMPYSFKTSLGRYMIGNAYQGEYGLSYKLYGLDSTNSRAYERAIVLHSDKNIPETEAYPKHIFQSAGCPAVAPSFLPVIGNYIKLTKKPILMWIYN